MRVSLELLLTQLLIRQSSYVEQEDTMNKSRTHLAVIGMVASLSLLAACSKTDEKTAVDTTAPAVVTPAPTPAPVVTAPAPVAEVTPAPSPAPVANNTDKMEELKESAKKAGDEIADTAKELKDDAVEAGKRAGDAIKEKADQADKAIQSKLGDGTAVENPKIPADPKN